MADLQEIIKTHTKSYPSYFHTYPRNGKTTVCVDFFPQAPGVQAPALFSSKKVLPSGG